MTLCLLPKPYTLTRKPCTPADFPNRIVIASCLLPEAPLPPPPLNSPNLFSPEASLDRSLAGSTVMSQEMSMYWDALDPAEERMERQVIKTLLGCRDFCG